MNVRRTSRKGSPFARSVSVLAAISVGALVAIGAGPAAADGGSAAGSAGAGSLGPSSIGSSSSKSTTTKTTTKSASSATSAGTVGKAAPATTDTQAFVEQFDLLAPGQPTYCEAQKPGSLLVGNFEIDGNTCVDDDGNKDWDDNGIWHSDGVKDDTAYTQGDAENTDAAGWHTGGSSQGKDDITDAWGYTEKISGHIWTFFGVHRVSDNGTTTYDVELNHLDNSAEQRPTRSVGDLLLQFSVTGNGPLSFDQAYRWTAIPIDEDVPAGCFRSGALAFGWCDYKKVATPSFESQVSADGLFAEGAIDLSALAEANGEICSGDFGQMNIRTVASESTSAALQDYVLPFDINIGSSCGSIVINKYAEGTTDHVGGAEFTISPDPTPGSNAPGPIALVDGGVGDADGSANGIITINPAQPKQYTVVETKAPDGYLLPADPADRTKVVTLAPGAGQIAAFNFEDPIKWQALTATKTAVPHYTATYHWSIAKEISADGQNWVTDSTLLDPLLVNVPANGDPTETNLSYRVKVKAGARTTSDYSVDGEITVNNPNAGDVTADLSDSLPGATCLVDGEDTKTVVVPSGPHAFPYECTFAGVPADLSGNNTATVAWDKSDYPQSDADQGAVGDYTASTPATPYAFGDETTAVDKTVTVTDDHHVFPGGFEVTWTAEGDETTSDVYTIPFSASPGTCSNVLVNSAIITGDTTGQLGDPAQAAGQICVVLGLDVADDVAGDFTRKFNWQIDKFIDGDQKSQTVTTADLTSPFDYTVTATPLSADDSDWVVSGTITVTNPNEDELIDPITVTGFSEILDLGVGTNCTYDKQAGDQELVLASGDHVDIGFSCTVEPTPNNDGAVPPAYLGTHQANATWGDDGTLTTDEADLTWHDPTEIDKTIAVYDNKVTEGAAPVHLGDAVWNAEGTPTTFTYQLTFTVPASTEGSCAPAFDNLAWLGGDGVTPTELQSGASATICVPAVIPPTPPKKPLPPTGGPDGQLLLWGLAMLLSGGAIVLMASRRERRS